MSENNDTNERIYDAITSRWGSRIIGGLLVIVVIAEIFGDFLPFGGL